jgi:hypothetical protein
MPAVATERDARAVAADHEQLRRNFPAPGEMTLRPFEAVWWLQSDD